MTWQGRKLAVWRFFDQPDKNVDVESSEMRKAIGLGWYVRPGDERMASEELGRCIDDCLVEIIGAYLMFLRIGYFSIEEFKSRMRKFEEGMKRTRISRPSQRPFRDPRSSLSPASPISTWPGGTLC